MQAPGGLLATGQCSYLFTPWATGTPLPCCHIDLWGKWLHFSCHFQTNVICKNQMALRYMPGTCRQGMWHSQRSAHPVHTKPWLVSSTTQTGMWCTLVIPELRRWKGMRIRNSQSSPCHVQGQPQIHKTFSQKWTSTQNTSSLLSTLIWKCCSGKMAWLHSLP